MRIIFLTSSSSLSGGTRQAMYLAQGLMARGHELIFFVPHNAEITGLDTGIDWRKLPANRCDWRADVEAALPAPGTPCIVHAFHNKANKKLAWWGLSWRKRGVATFGYRGVVYRPSNPLPYWSPGIDCFVANSQACARILNGIGLPKKRTAVIYNGIPQERVTPTIPAMDMRRKLGIGPDELVIGSVAGDKPVKGVQYLIEGFAQAVREGLDARLVVVGARPVRWDGLVQELGIADKCLFAGRQENVADYLQIYDVFVLPSLAESMPNVLAEAYFFGLPAIGSAVGGVPELIRGNGVLVGPKDANALALALGTLGTDDATRETMGASSLARAADFTLEKKIENTWAVYESVLRRRGLLPTI